MYKMKHIWGKMVRYNGKTHKVVGIRFTAGGVMYKLTGIREWISEKEV